jgi:small GTP-binding protein
MQEDDVSTVVTTLDGPLAAYREAEIRLLTDIATALAELGDAAQEDRQRLMDVAQDLREMFFLVVVIGEFNAGKSSFVNALLGDELLPVGVTPTTETIELIRYSETANRKPTVREDDIREWAHPNTGLPGVALVDTPGTGSVFQKHEKTAKMFLHRSDLVIFVISAKRALAETERLYLELAKDYGKKIILVVNQIDLLLPQERTEVRRFVERQVEELLDLRPLIFMVSAIEALNAQRSGSAEGGGIDALRAHLRGVLNEAPPTQQKLLAQLDLAERIVQKYVEQTRGRADLVSVDTAKVRDVQNELEQQSLGLNVQLQNARAEIDTVFEGLRRRGLSFINEHLSIRRLGRGTNREALQAEFQDVVIGRALRDINDASSDYVNALIDNSRLYWRGVIERLNQLRDLMEQELSGLDASVYAEQREALQDAIRIAEAELKSYSSGRVIGEMEDMFRTNMNGFTTSAAAAIIGIVVTLLAIAAPGGVIGASVIYASATVAFVVGAPLAALGSIAALRYYRKVTADTKRDFNQRVDQLQRTYHEALDDLTQRERNRLTQYGKQTLTPIFSRLEVLAARYAAQQSTLRQFEEQIETLRGRIEESKPA